MLYAACQKAHHKRQALIVLFINLQGNLQISLQSPPSEGERHKRQNADKHKQHTHKTCHQRGIKPHDLSCDYTADFELDSLSIKLTYKCLCNHPRHRVSERARSTRQNADKHGPTDRYRRTHTPSTTISLGHSLTPSISDETPQIMTCIDRTNIVVVWDVSSIASALPHKTP